MNVSKEISAKLIYPELDGFDNVLKIVEWNLIFEENGVESIAKISTTLDTSNLALTYIDITLVSDEEILAICLEIQGGQNFIDQLAQMHQPQIERQTMLNQLEPYLE